jgi:hypothetical protein
MHCEKAAGLAFDELLDGFEPELLLVVGVVVVVPICATCGPFELPHPAAIAMQAASAAPVMPIDRLRIPCLLLSSLACISTRCRSRPVARR